MFYFTILLLYPVLLNVFNSFVYRWLININVDILKEKNCEDMQYYYEQIKYYFNTIKILLYQS